MTTKGREEVMVLHVEVFYGPDDGSVLYIRIYGRRRGIRTPIQAPKASVLPLHYVLYVRALI